MIEARVLLCWSTWPNKSATSAALVEARDFPCLVQGVAGMAVAASKHAKKPLAGMAAAAAEGDEMVAVSIGRARDMSRSKLAPEGVGVAVLVPGAEGGTTPAAAVPAAWS